MSVITNASIKQAYLNKYSPTNPSLNQGMIEQKIITLLCHEIAVNEMDYYDHCNVLHGINAKKLQPKLSIKVDSKTLFKLCSALDIEKVGDEDRRGILTQWFNSSVESKVVIFNNNRFNSDIVKNRSKDFMNEAKKSTIKTFFDKYTHHIRPKVVGSLDFAFCCKWSAVEEAFYAAIGEQQVVPLYQAVPEGGGGVRPHPPFFGG